MSEPRHPQAFVLETPEREEEPQRKPRAITGITFEPEVDEGELWRFGKLAKQVNGVPSGFARMDLIVHAERKRERIGNQLIVVDNQQHRLAFRDCLQIHGHECI